MENFNDKIISSGFVIFNPKKEFLLGRIDGHTPPYQYTVFKGQQESGESLLDTAIRELREETDIDLLKEHKLNRYVSSEPLFQYTIKDRKTQLFKDIFLFFLEDIEGVLEDYPFQCNSFWQNTTEPEISGYKWVHLDFLDEYLLPSQRGLSQFLKNKYGKVN